MKKIGLIASALALVLCLSGCSNDKTISKEEAQKKALAEVNGDVTSYAQDLNDDTPFYAFDIVQDGKRYEVKVHAKTGDILSKELDEDYQTENEINNNANHEKTSVITEEEAKRAALDKVGGGNVVKCQLEEDDGTTRKYQIEIHYNNKEYEVDVDAVSKEILKVEENNID